jgi:hypothetical protein
VHHPGTAGTAPADRRPTRPTPPAGRGEDPRAHAPDIAAGPGLSAGQDQPDPGRLGELLVARHRAGMSSASWTTSPGGGSSACCARRRWRWIDLRRRLTTPGHWLPITASEITDKRIAAITQYRYRGIVTPQPVAHRRNNLAAGTLQDPMRQETHSGPPPMQ